MAAKLSNETYVHYHGNILNRSQLKQIMTSFRDNMHTGCCNPYVLKTLKYYVAKRIQLKRQLLKNMFWVNIHVPEFSFSKITLSVLKKNRDNL